MRPRVSTLILAAAACAAVALLAASASGQEQQVAGSDYGWLSLLPPLLAIVLALVTHDVLLALGLGVFGGALILHGWNPFLAFASSIDHFLLDAVVDRSHAPILIFTTLLGGMVGLLTKSGGTHGIVERLAPYATTSRRGQLATWIMGILVFFDDYANTLIVGPTMRPITDRLKISREKLAYIVDSTAAPVVCLFPISTWVGFEIGLIGDAFTQVGVTTDAYSAFLSSIPYRFYPIFALVLGFTIAASRFDFGPMEAAERRAEQGLVLAEDARPIAEYNAHELEPPPEIPKRAINALLPILTVVVVTLVGLYVTGAEGKTRAAGVGLDQWVRQVLSGADSLRALLWASLAGVLVAAILPVAQRLLPLRDTANAMIGGFKAMLMALVVLSLAWALGGVCKELHTADFLVHLTEGVVSPAWLPAITFALAAAISFATGTSWGTLSILEPLVIPICHHLAGAAGEAPGSEQYWTWMVATIASVMAGAVWGDHCSPISDTTILSSMASGCDHIAHVRTQIPYAVGAGALAIVIGKLFTAKGLSPWLALALGAVVIVVFVEGWGRLRERRRAAAG